jgi:lipoprotein NlpD
VAKAGLPGSENAGKAGYYTVKAGDTLIRIGLEHGQNWRDVARWNGIDNANLIEVGQVLRITPPGVETGSALARPVAGAGRVETRPIDGKAPGAAASAPAVTAAPAPAGGTPPAAAGPRDPEEDLNWLWPAAGPVIAGFDEGRNVKGLAIGGKAGDAVLAAADGRVVYAGSGLRGYGNLVIVKHNNTFLTAYAHNQALLVREDQVVRRGQKIAEMGSSDSDKVQLHFEIRRGGKPIDPSRLLPQR